MFNARWTSLVRRGIQIATKDSNIHEWTPTSRKFSSLRQRQLKMWRAAYLSISSARFSMFCISHVASRVTYKRVVSIRINWLGVQILFSVVLPLPVIRLGLADSTVALWCAGDVPVAFMFDSSYCLSLATWFIAINILQTFTCLRVNVWHLHRAIDVSIRATFLIYIFHLFLSFSFYPSSLQSWRTTISWGERKTFLNFDGFNWAFDV